MATTKSLDCRLRGNESGKNLNKIDAVYQRRLGGAAEGVAFVRPREAGLRPETHAVTGAGHRARRELGAAELRPHRVVLAEGEPAQHDRLIGLAPLLA